MLDGDARWSPLRSYGDGATIDVSVPRLIGDIKLRLTGRVSFPSSMARRPIENSLGLDPNLDAHRTIRFRAEPVHGGPNSFDTWAVLFPHPFSTLTSHIASPLAFKIHIMYRRHPESNQAL